MVAQGRVLKLFQQVVIVSFHDTESKGKGTYKVCVCFVELDRFDLSETSLCVFDGFTTLIRFRKQQLL